mgnify:FL=1
MEAREPYRFRAFTIPSRMMEGIVRYIDHGIPPGDFLTAVITNDFKEAVGRADEENLQNLPAYVAYFYNEAPSDCWGAKEKMTAWIEAKRTARAMPEAPGESATFNSRGSRLWWTITESSAFRISRR